MHQMPQVAPFARLWQRKQLNASAECFDWPDIWFSCLRRSVLRQGQAVEEVAAAQFSGFVGGPQRAQRYTNFSH